LASETHDAGVPNASPRHARNPVLTALGKAIRRARKERGFSQEALAHETEIDRAYMGSIERGDQNIGVMHLARIAYALEMTVTELVMEAAL
jgi:transcriptional regulator with XRE-family HTH domain